MNVLKKILCILIAVMLIVPFGALPKESFAEAGIIEVYTSADKAAPGEYYLNTDGIYQSLYDADMPCISSITAAANRKPRLMQMKEPRKIMRTL